MSVLLVGLTRPEGSLYSCFDFANLEYSASDRELALIGKKKVEQSIRDRRPTRVVTLGRIASDVMLDEYLWYRWHRQNIDGHSFILAPSYFPGREPSYWRGPDQQVFVEFFWQNLVEVVESGR